MDQNSIHIIIPYKLGGQWVFDDAEKYLHREAFVAGADAMLDQLIQKYNIKNANMGFILIFASIPYPDHTSKYVWTRAQADGNWYTDGETEGWLCPALMKYFNEVPKELYVKVKDLS